MEIPKVNAEECIACEMCIEICPAKTISIVDSKAQIEQEKCKVCRICVMACPVGAIN
jgi:Fe-S-cluster-containing hydrogenase component 2